MSLMIQNRTIDMWHVPDYYTARYACWEMLLDIDPRRNHW